MAMRCDIRWMLCAATGALLAEPGSALAGPVTSAFTYQGTMQDGGVPVNAAYDFQFRLLDAASGGAQVGATLCADNVSIVDGQFAVVLDFGAVFAGQQRFLEILTRADTGLTCANAAGFSALSPRQELTATPNAAFASASGQAATATNASALNGQPASFYTNASNLTGGTLSAGLLPATAARTDTTQTISGTKTFSTAPAFSPPAGAPFSVGSTTKVASLNADLLDGLDSAAFAATGHTHDAASLVSGLLADARLSANIPRLNAANTFTADAAFLTQVGVGVANGSSVPLWVQKTEAGSNSVNLNTVLALENSGAAYVQMFTPAANESGILFGHVNPDTSIGAGIVYNNTAATQGLQFRSGGNATRMTLDSAGFLGIGTSSPAAPLHVVANIDVGATGGGSFMVGSATGAALRADANELQAFSGATPSALSVQAIGANFGVGTTVPAEKLHVVGNGRIDGNLAVTGAITIPATTRYLAIPADSFRDNSNIDIFPGFMQNSAFLSGSIGDTTTGVSLPDGAVVTGVELVLSDTANTNANVTMYRQPFDGSTLTTMGSATSSGTGGFQTPQDTSISSATIDNSQYFYRVEISWAKESDGLISVYGVRIRYTVTQPLP